MHSMSAGLAKATYDARPKILSSPTPDVQFDRNATFHELLLKTLESESCINRTIFDVEKGITYSYREMADWIRRCATAFAERFVLPGDTILFVGNGSCEYFAYYFGAMAVGVTVRLLRYSETVNVQDIQTECIQNNIHVLVICEKLFNKIAIKKLNGSINLVSHVIVYNRTGAHILCDDCPGLEQEIYENCAPAENEDLYHPKHTASAPAMCIPVISGSSALYSHYSLCALWKIASSNLFECLGSDKALVYSTFTRIGNLQMFVCALASRCDVIIEPDNDLSNIVATIQKHKVTFAWLPANKIFRLLKSSEYSSLEPLRKIISFIGRVSQKFCHEFFLKFTSVKSLRHCLSVPESTIPISLMVFNSHEYDSVGVLLPNTRLKITQNPWSPDPVEVFRVGIFMFERERDLFAMGKYPPNSAYLEPLVFEKPEDIEVPIVTPVLKSSEKYRQRLWLRLNIVGYYDDNELLFRHGAIGESKQPIVTRIRNCLWENEVIDALWSHPKVENLALIKHHTNHYTALIVPSSYTRTHFPSFKEMLSVHVEDKIKESSMLSGEENGNKLLNIFLCPNIPKTDQMNMTQEENRKFFNEIISIRRKF